MAILAVTASFASVASGGAPMGLPNAWVDQGRWAVGGEYGYEQMNLESSGRVTQQIFGQEPAFWTQRFRIDDLASNMFFGTIAYGISENWDIFARVGAADAKGTVVALPASTDALTRQDDVDGSFGLAWGAGTRATLYRCGPWSFGGLVQVTWFRPGDSAFSITDPLQPDESWAGDAELKYWQLQASLAAVYQVENWRFWAGPFLQAVYGDLNFRGTSSLTDGPALSTIRWSSSIDESYEVGAHLGVNWELSNEWSLWAEGQITGDSWLVGVGGAFSPEKALDQ